MEKLLISSCLLGLNTKYNGGNNYLAKVELLKSKYELIPFCAEVEGGLPTPRFPSEIKDLKVINNQGLDVTKEFNEGANLGLKLVKELNITKALLKESSPSCGVNKVYDGTFTKTKVNGMGVLASKLKAIGINLYTENDIDILLK